MPEWHLAPIAPNQDTESQDKYVVQRYTDGTRGDVYPGQWAYLEAETIARKLNAGAPLTLAPRRNVEL